jgi:tellurite resistance protein TerC
VIAALVFDLFVLHRRSRQLSVAEAGAWSAGWVALAIGFGVLLWSWRGAETGQAYLTGYLIEWSLSLDNVFVFTVIFSMFAIPARYQHRVLMAGIIGALGLRAGFIAGGTALLDSFHLVIYVFGALLLWTAVRMLRSDAHAGPGRRMPGLIQRFLPATSELHGQRFLVRERGRWLATPLLTALIVVEAADVIFAADSIPAIFAVTTDTFVVFTSTLFAVLGLRALYFLIAGAVGRFRYLRPGLSVILAAAGAKLLLSDVYEIPAWVSPAFITLVLGVVAVMSVLDARRRPAAARQQDPGREDEIPDREDQEPARREEAVAAREAPASPEDPPPRDRGSATGPRVPARSR